jgi:translation initiation factor 2 subunit 2
MGYEDLLDEAYKTVKPCEDCDRFEVKKVEGHHEGGKTIISNFSQVTVCLRRKPQQLAKFLFRELAAPGEIAGERLILTGKLASQTINDKIDKYVKSYVLCSNCKKPDTEITEEQGKKFIRCLACGNKKAIA